MTTPKAILIGSALIALSVYLMPFQRFTYQEVQGLGLVKVGTYSGNMELCTVKSDAVEGTHLLCEKLKVRTLGPT